MRDIGKLLKACRKEKDYSVRYVSDWLLKEHGITASEKTIYGWENGISLPVAADFMCLCRIYELEVKDFFEEDPEEFCLSDEEKDLIRGYRSRPEYATAIKKLLLN